MCATAVSLSVAFTAPSRATAQTPDNWDWSAWYASDRVEFANDVAVDSLNRAVYAAGQAEGGFSGILGGLLGLLFGSNTGADGYLVKRGTDGTFKWEIVIGGSGDDAITGVCVDRQGNVYVTGYFAGASATFMGVSGSDQRMSSAGAKDIFIACYSPDGTLIWKQCAGGSDNDQGTSICEAGGRIYVAGSFMGAPSIAGMATSPSAAGYANRSHGFLVALDAGTGNGIWRIDGANGENSAFNGVATDGDQVYVIGVHKGASYGYSGTATTSSVLATATNSLGADVAALSTLGTIKWSQAVANPGDDVINALGIASSTSAVYISGSTHHGSTFPGGMVVSPSAATHDFGYVARLDRGTGTTKWVRTFYGPNSGNHTQVARDLATDSHGDLLVTGMFRQNLYFPSGPTLTGYANLQVFLAKYNASGSLKWALAAPGEEDDQANGVATDKNGLVAIAGSYKEDIRFNALLQHAGSPNLFFAWLSDLDHSVAEFRDPSVFTPLAPLCADNGPIDLTTRYVPEKSGPGVSVVSSSGITSGGNNGPGAALGQNPGGVAVFDNTNDQIVIDMGVTIPQGESIIIRWRSVSGTATMNIQASPNSGSGYIDHGPFSTSSTAMVLKGIVTTAPVRYIKLTRGGSATCEVDGVYYNFGSATDGIWSGSGVTGNTFDPAGLSGNVAITYTAQGRSTTHTVQVSPVSNAGTLNGGGTICPDGTADLSLSGSIGSFIIWRTSTNGGSTWSNASTNQTTHTLTNVTVPTKVTVQVTSGTCPSANSSIIDVLPLDTVPPTITCPASVSVNTNTGCTATSVALGTPVTVDNCGIASAINNAPSAFPIGTTTVVWSVTDNSSNTATCSQTVTVIDNVLPTITCPAAVSVNTNTGCTATGVALGTPITGDNCGIASVTNNAPAAFPHGTTTVTWTVTDNSTNTATCAQTVTVVDNLPPTITCPAPVNVNTNTGCTATSVALGTPVTADNCGITSVINNAPSAFPVGPTTVTWTVTDNSNNSATCSQTVTVTDVVPPTITCPAPVNANTNSGCTATGVALGTAITADNCGIASAINNAPSAFPIGTTTVVWSVTDNSSNTATCSQTVTVIDNVLPTITCPAAVSVNTNTGCTATGVALGTPITGDNCGIASVTNNAPAAFPHGPTTVTWTVTDNSTNTATCAQTVTVVDNLPPTITCPAPVNANTNSGCLATGVALGTPVTGDNCGIASVTNNAPAAFPLGPTTVTWTVTDNSTNTATCAQTVTIVDHTPPFAVCRDITVNLDEGGIAYVLDTEVDNGSTDNCSGITFHLTTVTYHALGLYTDTLIVNDAVGNSNSCLAAITVVDVEPPTAACNTVTIPIGTSGTAVVTAAELDGGSIDNGGPVTLLASRTTFDCSRLGENIDTLQVTDASGNTSYCLATVIVVDTITPYTGNAAITICANASPLDLNTVLPSVLQPGGSWNNPDDSSITGIIEPAHDASGPYTYTTSGHMGCGTDLFRVDLSITALPYAGRDTSLAICSIGSASDLMALLPGADPGGSWCSNSGTYDPAVADPGTYCYAVAGNGPCPADTAFIQVTEVNAPNAGQSGSTSICSNSAPMDLSSVLGGLQDAGGTWTTSSGDLSSGLYDPYAQSDDTFTYTVLGSAPCASAGSTVTVTETQAPSAAWDQPGPLCADAGPIDLTAYITGNSGGAWTGAGITENHFFDPASINLQGASQSGPLLYTVSAFGCTTSSSGDITVWGAPIADAGVDTSVCGLEYRLDPMPTIGEGHWTLSGQVGISDLLDPHATIHVDGPGSRSLFWTVVNGSCTARDTVRITFHPPWELSSVDAGPDRIQEVLTAMDLNGTADGATNAWWTVVSGGGEVHDPSALNTTVSGLSIGENTLILSARAGACPAVSDTVTLTVRGVFVPTGFSPNGDGVNDLYVVRGLENSLAITLNVFDRWGIRVFHAAPYANGWDGLGENGRPLMDGTYYVVLTIDGKDLWNGSITLKR